MYTSRWLLVHCKERWRIACLYSSSFFSKTIFLFTEEQNLLPLITYIWRNTVVGKLLPWKGLGLTLGSMDLVAAKAAVLSVKVFACTPSSTTGSTERAPPSVNAVRKLGVCCKIDHKPDRSSRKTTRLQCPENDKHFWCPYGAVMGAWSTNEDQGWAHTSVFSAGLCGTASKLQLTSWKLKKYTMADSSIDSFSVFLGILTAGACWHEGVHQQMCSRFYVHCDALGSQIFRFHLLLPSCIRVQRADFPLALLLLYSSQLYSLFRTDSSDVRF